MLTAKHSTSGGNAAAECNGIVSWIEVSDSITLFIPGYKIIRYKKNY